MDELNLLLIGAIPAETGSKSYGGVAKVVWYLAKALKNSGITPVVSPWGQRFSRERTIDDVPIYGLGLDINTMFDTVRIAIKNREAFSGKPLKYKLYLIYSLYLLSYLAKRIRIDCINVHHVYNQIPLAADILQLDVPVVATIHSYHDVLMEKSAYQKTKTIKNYQEQLRCVDYVTHVSQSVREQGKALGMTWECEDKVIYNGVEFPLENLSHYDSIESQRTQICFSGSLAPRKGVLKLLEAIRILGSNVEKTVLTGTGELREAIIEYIDKHDVNVELLGYLPKHDQVFDIMATSSVFVMPSVSETFGLVYIEALLSGTPVIGFHSIMKEFWQFLDCTQEERDWFVPFNYDQEDAHDLARKIKQSLGIKNRATYHQERDNIREKIIGRFRWKDIAKEYKKAYKDARTK